MGAVCPWLVAIPTGVAIPDSKVACSGLGQNRPLPHLRRPTGRDQSAHRPTADQPTWDSPRVMTEFV